MLGVRLAPKLDRQLAAIARQRRTTKSAIAREAIERFLADGELAKRAEAQSRRVAELEGHAPGVLDHDDRGWTR